MLAVFNAGSGPASSDGSQRETLDSANHSTGYIDKPPSLFRTTRQKKGVVLQSIEGFYGEFCHPTGGSGVNSPAGMSQMTTLLASSSTSGSFG